jgi:hypothetical protein
MWGRMQHARKRNLEPPATGTPQNPIRLLQDPPVDASSAAALPDRLEHLRYSAAKRDPSVVNVSGSAARLQLNRVHHAASPAQQVGQRDPSVVSLTHEQPCIQLSERQLEMLAKRRPLTEATTPISSIAHAAMFSTPAAVVSQQASDSSQLHASRAVDPPARPIRTPIPTSRSIDSGLRKLTPVQDHVNQRVLLRTLMQNKNTAAATRSTPLSTAKQELMRTVLKQAAVTVTASSVKTAAASTNHGSVSPVRSTSNSSMAEQWRARLQRAVPRSQAPPLAAACQQRRQQGQQQARVVEHQRQSETQHETELKGRAQLERKLVHERLQHMQVREDKQEQVDQEPDEFEEGFQDFLKILAREVSGQHTQVRKLIAYRVLSVRLRVSAAEHSHSRFAALGKLFGRSTEQDRCTVGCSPACETPKVSL